MSKRKDWRMTCINCNYKLKLTKAEAGQNTIQCPKCKTLLDIDDISRDLDLSLITNNWYVPHYKKWEKVIRQIFKNKGKYLAK